MMPHGIQTLKVWEAIRKRPAWYVGALDDPKLATNLLAEALCVARSTEGVTRIGILTHSGGKATLCDNGPGWDVSIGPRGRRRAESLLRELYACRKAKDKDHEGHCNMGVVTLVALSEEFHFKTFRNGRVWSQHFQKGAPVTAFEDDGLSTTFGGTVLEFVLDKSILPSVEFDAGAMQTLVASLRQEGFTVDLS